MIRYQVRSRDLVGLYNEISAKRLIPDAYFQRNLVWRLIHKQDFIKTILLGYPFPQIFISKGKIDIESMQTTSCIVDGQQRMNAICEFIENKFIVDGKYYKELDSQQKSDFLKFEIAIIELDIENTDSRIKDIFLRINRTANALTSIEKLASEYASSEFMFCARVLLDDVDLEPDEDLLKIDPLIDPELLKWASQQKARYTTTVFLKDDIFSGHELARKVHIQYMLNIIATNLSGYYNRNEKSMELLQDYAENFPERDRIFQLIEKTSYIFNSLKLPKKSIWRKKANFFTLFVELALLAESIDKSIINSIREKLLEFEEIPPQDFKLAAQEAVNNKLQRQTRGTYVKKIFALVMK